MVLNQCRDLSNKVQHQQFAVENRIDIRLLTDLIIYLSFGPGAPLGSTIVKEMKVEKKWIRV
jgi:hypothetical protein